MTVTPFAPPLAELDARLKQPVPATGRILHLTGLKGSGAALLLSRMQNMSVPGFLVICEDLEQGRELSRDLESYRHLLAPGDAAANETPELLFLPPLPRLPYRPTLRSGRLERERIRALERLRRARFFFCFTTIAAAFERLPDPAELYQRFFRIEWGDKLDREELCHRLEAAGYSRVPAVDEPGDYSLRGGIVDIFSPLYDDPVRLDFFGDEIESLRPFDHLTQLSRKTELESFVVAPAREVLPPADLGPARQRLRKYFVALNRPGLDLKTNLEKLEQSPHQPGFENWLPAFAAEHHCLFSYLPDGTLPIFIDPATLAEQIEELEQQYAEAYANALEENRLVFPPSEWLVAGAERLRPAAGEQVVYLENGTTAYKLPPGLATADEEENTPETVVLDFATSDNRFLRDAIRQGLGAKDGNPLQQAVAILKEHLRQGFSLFMAGRNQTTGERLQGLFKDYGLPVVPLTKPTAAKPAALQLAPLALSRGVLIPQEKLLFLSDADLFGSKRKLSESPAAEHRAENFFDDFATLKPGELITHIEHGIGRYQGLKTLEVEGVVNEYLILEYLDGDLLYVPVDSFSQLHKYHGGGAGETRLSRLGGTQWAAAKLKTRQAIDDFLTELLDLYAARAVVEGRPCQPPDHLFREFEAAFPYEETPDQRRAITEVIKDLQAPKPMDRLVSGDVGFGKTEVAMRAVFLTVLSGRQAAVMVPTTVLAQQHYETFRKRFADYPVKIAVLSRFRTPAQQREVIAGLKAGTIDVVIGTHRLLQKDIAFRDLGLLVLDEEHKFGVRHKEKLKIFRRQLDVLSLSATPIPRTLQFALSGMRSLSVITTAPRDRLAIRTFVSAYDDMLVHDAVTKELNRGGQVFFVHNTVATIATRAARLEALLPGVRIAIGHGQMKEAELEQVMLDFAAHRFDLLLCTTIIESGLDIPNANTMIIENAQNFGLAQLYQLRGRIGRSQRKAYAYLLVPSLEGLSSEARKRLNALAEANTLGAGFRIAMQDLEIRGAGNLLGRKQWGQISAVGYELYQEMLNEAIAEARGQRITKIPDPELRIGVSAHIPPPYLPDLTLRLQFYKRIAAAESEEHLSRLEDELTDRCGPPPEEVVNLLRQRNLKLLLQRYRIRALELGRKSLVLTFDPEHPPATEKLLALLAETETRSRLTPDGRLWLELELELEPEALHYYCEKLLARIF